MCCDTVRELLDDLDRGRLGPFLEAEVTGHLAGCAACREEQERVRGVVAALQRLPAPVLPTDLTAAVAVRRAVSTGRAEPPALARARRFGAAVLSHGVVAAAAAGIALILGAPANEMPPGGATPADSASMVTVSPESEPGIVATVSGTDESADTPLHVSRGGEVGVKVVLEARRPVKSTKVHLVLPKGLAFSRKAHPNAADHKVLTLRNKDLSRGPRSFEFRVKGTKVGKWDVLALVEDGDNVSVAGATVVVDPDQNEEESL